MDVSNDSQLPVHENVELKSSGVDTIPNVGKRTNTRNVRPRSQQQQKNPRVKNKKKGRHGARNQHRHKLMVKWIAHKFPDSFKEAKDATVDMDNSSSPDKEDEGDNDCTCNDGHGHGHGHGNKKQQQHILDVAGGKGELSARLSLCHTLHVRMVDPRPANVLQVFQKTVFRSLPKKWQQRISSQHPSKIESALHRRFQQLEQCFPSDGRAEDVMGQLNNDRGLKEAVENASLLIGMHADGATEAIVDVALRYRKPFVVVPCCVFPNFFKHRFVPSRVDLNFDFDDDGVDDDTYTTSTSNNNESKENETEVRIDTVAQTETETEIKIQTDIHMMPVRSHTQFCQYLALKDSHFVVERLPFEGRNVAIWWDGLCRDGDEDEDEDEDGDDVDSRENER